MNRRDFLRHTGHAVSAAALYSSFGQMQIAQAADYKALVCVFLYGGNDGNNTLIPIDTEGYAQYAKVRPVSSNLNIAQSSWLPISASGKSYGLHPSFKGVQGLYAQGKLAWVANVGTLAEPTTRAQYLARSVNLPKSLFSHSDQQNEWQTARTAMTPVTTGWGGRLGDDVAQSFNLGAKFPSLVNISGSGLFTRSLSAGVITPGPSTLQGFGGSSEDQARYAAFRNLQTLKSRSTLVNRLNGITADGINATDLLTTALASQTALSTSFPNSSLGNQLKSAARMMAARGTLGVSRQIFFCGIGGFDTHTNQIPQQRSLFSDLDASLNAFHSATVELGIESDVLTFTHSDFGRTFQPTAGAGSDHAWGSHHLVMGGGIKGGDIYGQYPTLVLGGPDDADKGGRWVPSTSVVEFVYPMARWFGATHIDQVLPTLSNFNQGRKDLAFL